MGRLRKPSSAVERRRTVVLNPTRVTKSGVVHLLAGHAARGGDSGHLLSGLGEYRFLAGEVRHPPEDHIAVRRADLDAVPGPAEHVGRGHRCAATEKRIEDDVAGVGERLHKELNQRTWEGSRVRALAALGLHLDHVARPRDAGEPAILVREAILKRWKEEGRAEKQNRRDDQASRQRDVEDKIKKFVGD